MTVENMTEPRAPFTLVGKTAIVTGAGRGIGRALVQLLASAGARILASDLDGDALQETESLVCSRNLIVSLSGDLTIPSFPNQIVDAALETFQSIDIIVN